MDILKFFGREHYESFKATTKKTVCCSSCELTYQYRLKRSGTGSSFKLHGGSVEAASAEAQDHAFRALQRKLRDGSDLVPCPRCGHIQANMIDAARETRLIWLGVLAVVPGVISMYAMGLGITWLTTAVDRVEIKQGMIGSAVGFGLFGVACGLTFLRWYLNQRFNPNHWPLGKRLEIARRRCLKPESANVSEDTFIESRVPINTPESADHSSLIDIGPTLLEVDESEKKVSSATKATAGYFFWFGGLLVFVGLMMLVVLPFQALWRAPAVLAIAVVIWMFAFAITKLKS
jgi:hypothetical protein